MHCTLLASKKKKYAKQTTIFGGLLFLFFLFSCSSKEKLASVGEHTLHEEDLVILMKNDGLNPEDKSERKKYIERWITNQVYLEELRVAFPEQWKTVVMESKMYSGELAKIFLEEKSLRKELDLKVSDKELNEYYEAHKSEYLLQDYLVRGLFLKIPKAVNFKEEKVDQYYLLKNDKDLVHLDSYAKLYAENYYYNDSSWIYFDEFLNDVPANLYNKDRIVLNRSKTYFSDEEYVYFVNVIDYKLKDQESPLDFLKKDLTEQILMQRYQNLRIKNEKKYFEEIKKKHEINRNY